MPLLWVRPFLFPMTVKKITGNPQKLKNELIQNWYIFLSIQFVTYQEFTVISHSNNWPQGRCRRKEARIAPDLGTRPLREHSRLNGTIGNYVEPWETKHDTCTNDPSGTLTQRLDQLLCMLRHDMSAEHLVTRMVASSRKLYVVVIRLEMTGGMLHVYNCSRQLPCLVECNNDQLMWMATTLNNTNWHITRDTIMYKQKKRPSFGSMHSGMYYKEKRIDIKLHHHKGNQPKLQTADTRQYTSLG